MLEELGVAPERAWFQFREATQSGKEARHKAGTEGLPSQPAAAGYPCDLGHPAVLSPCSLGRHLPAGMGGWEWKSN